MIQISKDLIPALNESLQLKLPAGVSLEELKDLLSVYVNDLIQSDFEKLVSLLYRIDVSESKLTYLLKENPGEDAGRIIADLIIERQLQKIKSRQQHSKRDDNITEDEKW
jgi:hypothetical protein